jgi:hypothetical protein
VATHLVASRVVFSSLELVMASMVNIRNELNIYPKNIKEKCHLGDSGVERMITLNQVNRFLSID